MNVRRKWRPPLALLVAFLVALVFFLPTAAMAIVVIVSREPGALIASLLGNWAKIAAAMSAVILLTGLTGYVFWRGLTRPLRALASNADAVARGTETSIAEHSYGTRDIARLAGSFAILVERLQQRSRYLETLSAHLAHELRSPLTSIRGAAELLRDGMAEMEPAQRRRFLDNIVSDTDQLASLAGRLRELARANLATGSGSVELSEVAAEIGRTVPGLSVKADTPSGFRLPMHRDIAELVLHHVADNARRHGATTLVLSQGPNGSLDIGNDGRPIHAGDRERIFEPFYTTRRSDGGTGLGLAIVATLLETANGRIALVEADPVRFRIQFGP